VPRDFHQIEWDALTAEDCRQLVRLAIREDLEREQDWTTVALVPPERTGAAEIVARAVGVVAGVPALAVAVEEFDADLKLEVHAADGDDIAAGGRVARISGNVRDLLTSERTLLNLLGRLMGIATLTREYVARVAGTRCRVYDTRKTTPGWRRLEKFAVRCGGGHNHRTGLYDAVLIKDNHLAVAQREGLTMADVIARVRQRVSPFLKIEIEVESVAAAAEAAAAGADLILLDNMAPALMAEAVAAVDGRALVEASGGITFDNLPEVVASGVDLISSGSFTHSVRALDISLDIRT
jgi:nicotinate-nucleotide pyrophosphorylase (carboxylating)